MKKPNSRRNLDLAIQRLYGENEAFVRARTIMANAVVAQLLPDGSVKGGSAIKMRFGDRATRFTTDLDVARTTALDSFVESMAQALADGWEGFTGTIVPREAANPAGVPEGYVMQPFDIKLAYNTSPWCTVRLEVGHNEVGDADDPDWVLPGDVRAMFLELGFAEPGPMPLMTLDHQVAQKLHAISCPGSSRVHDLVDLQVIVEEADLDLALVRKTCERLFAYRAEQAWPPVIALGEGWDESYTAQRGTLDVLPSAVDAVTWANDLVNRIARA